MPFISEKRKKMGGQESEARASSKERIGGTSNQEIPCPTGGLEPIIWTVYGENGAGNAMFCLTFSLSGQAPGGWVGSVGLPLSHPSAVPMRVHCRPHGAHCLQRSGHRKPKVVERKNAVCVTMAGLELFVHL